jgi:hypothetical protein
MVPELQIQDRGGAQGIYRRGALGRTGPLSSLCLYVHLCLPPRHLSNRPSLPPNVLPPSLLRLLCQWCGRVCVCMCVCICVLCVYGGVSGVTRCVRMVGACNHLCIMRLHSDTHAPAFLAPSRSLLARAQVVFPFAFGFTSGILGEIAFGKHTPLPKTPSPTHNGNRNHKRQTQTAVLLHASGILFPVLLHARTLFPLV